MDYSSIPNPPIFDTRDKFIFFPNNKCGQTSVTGGSKGQNEKGALVKRCIVKKAKQKRWEEEAKRPHPDVIKFTIIRHPYDRFLSTYRYLKDKYSYRTLDDFINLIKRNGKFDPHLQPQWPSSFTSESSLTFLDYILRLEQIEKDWEKIRSQIQAKPFPQLNTTGSNKSSSSLQLTVGQKEFVQEQYKRDFELFGFER